MGSPVTDDSVGSCQKLTQLSLAFVLFILQGIFSLALLHRTGEQCRDYYRRSAWFRNGEEEFSHPLLASRSCLLHNSSTFREAWITPLGKQVSESVDRILAGQGQLTRVLRTLLVTEAQNPTPPPVPVIAVPPQCPVQHSRAPGWGRHHIPALDAGPDSLSVTPLSSHEPKHHHHHGQQQQQPPSKRRRTEVAHSPPAPASVVSIQSSGKRQAPLRAPFAEKQTPPLTMRAQHPPTSNRDGDSSDDEFVAGTLRGVPSLKSPSLRPLSERQNHISQKMKSKSKDRKLTKSLLCGSRFLISASSGHHVPSTRLASSTSFRVTLPNELLGIGDVEDKITLLKLDKQRSLPGWGRVVLPYAAPDALPNVVPSNNDNKGGTDSPEFRDCRQFTTENILCYNFAHLRGEHSIVGAIVNAPLVTELTPSCPKRAITVGQLTLMPLTDCLSYDAIVCVWSPKELVGAVTRAMSTAWGCKYVENLTWVQLKPGGQVREGGGACEIDRYVRRSHATLVIGRRGSGDLELRHQRTADVVIAPALGGGRFPDAVRKMMETLLPDAQGGVALGCGSQKEALPRLLEVAFHGVEQTLRPGWVRLAQKKDT